jgi:hypothetical protein
MVWQPIPNWGLTWNQSGGWFGDDSTKPGGPGAVRVGRCGKSAQVTPTWNTRLGWVEQTCQEVCLGWQEVRCQLDMLQHVNTPDLTWHPHVKSRRAQVKLKSTPEWNFFELAWKKFCEDEWCNLSSSTPRCLAKVTAQKPCGACWVEFNERLACLHAKQFELISNSNTAHCTPCSEVKHFEWACESKSV